MEDSGQLIEVRVSALVRDAGTDAPVVLLQLLGTQRHLPIWIGDAEANAIALVLAGRRFERPLTHDLLQQVIDGLGAELTRVVITGMEGNTYYARLHLVRGEEIISVDARPSDSIALALRCAAPIYLSRELAESQAASMLEAEADDEKQKAVEELIRDVQRGMGRDQPEPGGSEDSEDSEDEEGGEWPSSGPGGE